MRLTDNGMWVTEIELSERGCNLDFFDVTGITPEVYEDGYDADRDEDVYCDDDLFEVDDVNDCIRTALDWKYSVDGFSEFDPDKDERHVYVDGREIDAYSDIALHIGYDGYDSQEYRERIDSIRTNLAIAEIREDRLGRIELLKSARDELKRMGVVNPFGDARYNNIAWDLVDGAKEKISNTLASLASKGTGYESLKHFSRMCSANLADAIPHMPDADLLRAAESTDDDMREFATLCSKELSKRQSEAKLKNAEDKREVEQERKKKRSHGR